MHRPILLAAFLAAPLADFPGPPAAPARAPRSAFDYDRRAPLIVGDSLEEPVEGIERHRLTFETPDGGCATALLYLPGRAGPRPVVLVGHGAPGDSRGYATTTTALAAARLGAVVLVLDAPFARRKAPPLTFTPRDSADRVAYVVDWRRAIDYLASRPDVDPARIAYVGTSFGGATGVLLAGVERRIAAFVLRVGDGGYVSHFSEPCGRDDLRPRLGPDRCLYPDSPLAALLAEEREAWYRAVWPVEPIRFLGRARAPMLLQNARRDEAVHPASAQRLHDAAPKDAVREWYDGGHRLPNTAMLSGLRFLAERVRLDRPDADFEAWLTRRTTPPPTP